MFDKFPLNHQTKSILSLSSNLPLIISDKIHNLRIERTLIRKTRNINNIKGDKRGHRRHRLVLSFISDLDFMKSDTIAKFETHYQQLSSLKLWLSLLNCQWKGWVKRLALVKIHMAFTSLLAYRIIIQNYILQFWVCNHLE